LSIDVASGSHVINNAIESSLVAVAQLIQPVPFGHPRFIRSYKIVWRGAAPCSVVR
jgi:hypothetical protein